VIARKVPVEKSRSRACRAYAHTRMRAWGTCVQNDVCAHGLRYNLHLILNYSQQSSTMLYRALLFSATLSYVSAMLY